MENGPPGRAQSDRDAAAQNPPRQCCCRMAFATRNIKYRAGRELEITSPMAGCGVPETSTTPHRPDGQLGDDARLHVCAVEATPAAGNPQA